MTNLSPSTQAIIDASNCAGSRCVQLHIADALRAVADQLREAYANEEYVDSADDWLDDIADDLGGIDAYPEK